MNTTAARLDRWLAPRHAAYVVAGGALGLLGAVVMWTVAWTGIATAVIGVGLVILLAVLPLSDFLTQLHRSRAFDLLDQEIVPVAPTPHGWREKLRSLAWASTWRQLAYHFLWGMVLALPAAVLVGWCAAGLALGTVFAWSGGISAATAAWWQPSTRGGRTLAMGLGVAILATTPLLARVLSRLDLSVTRPALGATRVEELRPRVRSLEESRAGLIEAADAERRRIERDLHDGAQQRLTSLAMNLGMARSALSPEAPAEARAAIEEAHDEAKQALAELRGFVRGLHPAVLDSRGLDAALSGIVSRSPVPATLHVTLPARPPPIIEAVAYFVVSEALTNVARHSGANAADVLVVSDGRRLVVEVTDDGKGGADAVRGTGLTGLASRVAAVDGTLTVTSPTGGPTTLRADLPCVS